MRVLYSSCLISMPYFLQIQEEVIRGKVKRPLAISDSFFFMV